MLLVPKEINFESAGFLPFHLDLKFPDEVNHVTASECLDEVCCSFHIELADVRLFVHDSQPYMSAAAERFIKDKGYINCDVLF